MDVSSFVKPKSTFLPTAYNDDSCPPHKIVNTHKNINGRDVYYWTLDNYITRITGEHYNFMYDRNRAKWIQLIDIDVGALAKFLNDNESIIPPIVVTDPNWDKTGLENYRVKNTKDELEDIRYNYSTNRTNFFSNYADGSYIYPKNDKDNNYPTPIPIGIRLINATKLPNKGLTFCSHYPLYIKGDFNTDLTTEVNVSGSASGTASGTLTGTLSSGEEYTMAGPTTVSSYAYGKVNVTASGEASGTMHVSVQGSCPGASVLGNGDIYVSGRVDNQGNLSVSGMGNISVSMAKGVWNNWPRGFEVVHLYDTALVKATGTGSVNFTNGTKPRPPALIIADSITILPDDWQDWRSQMDPINSPFWHNGEIENDPNNTTDPGSNGPTIYADIITGRTHPHFWIQSPDVKNGIIPNSDLGIHDAFRTLCPLNSPIQLHGSLMLPYFCREQWEPPINFCKMTNRRPNICGYPSLTMHKREDAGISMGMPFYYRINRGRKTHYLGKGAYDLLSGNKLYGKDWSPNRFSDYHKTLPNYLQYEVAP